MSRAENKVRVATDTSILALALVIKQAMGLVRGLFIPAILGPATYGVWKLIQVIFQYFSYTHIGLVSALTREIPIAIGKKDKNEYEKVKDVVFTQGLFLNLVAIGIFVVLYLTGLFKWDVFDSRLIALFCVWVLTRRYGDDLLRRFALANARFYDTARFEIIYSLSATLIAVPLAFKWNLHGLICGLILADIISIIFMIIQTKFKFQLRFDIKKTIHLIKIGFPIFLNSIGHSIYWTIDSIMIGAFLGTEQLGYYGLGLTVLTFMQPLPDSLGTVMVQKMARDRGRYGLDDLSYLQKYMEKPFLVLLLMVSLMVGAGYFLLPILISLFLPAYLPSITPLKFLLLGFLFYRMRTLTGYSLNITDRQYWILAILIISLGINILLDYLLITNGYGIVGVAWGCSVSYFLFGILMVMVSFRYIYKNFSHPIKFIAKISMVFLVECLSLVLLDRLSFFKSGILLTLVEGLLKVIVVTGVSILMFTILFKDFPVIKELLKMLSEVRNRVAFHRA